MISYQVGERGVKVSQLQYANDSLIVGKKSWKNIWAIKAVMKLFEPVSGLKVNFNPNQLQNTWLAKALEVVHCKVGIYHSSIWVYHWWKSSQRGFMETCHGCC